jgi:hypothetical protein
MSVATIERPARLRKSRTRTRNVNGREALTISTLGPHQYDLRSACASLICPDCKTWTPITGVQGRSPKLVPHHAGTANVDSGNRCNAGSNRRIVVDVRIDVWRRRLEQGVAETNARR